MTSRLLPPDEWHRLDETLMQSIWRDFDPAYAEVIVVESDGEIVGSVALLSTIHAECCESHGTAVGRMLWNALSARVKELGGSAVWGSAIDDPMKSILIAHGEPIPGEHFLVRV